MEKLNGIDALIKHIPQISYGDEVLFQDEFGYDHLLEVEEKEFPTARIYKVREYSDNELISEWDGQTLTTAVAECLFDCNWITMEEYDTIPDVPQVEFSIDETEVPDIYWFD
jgi:hypothetical protein